MVKVKFEKNFWVKENKPCALLKLYLPCEKGTKMICPELRSPDVSIMDSPLDCYWGWYYLNGYSYTSKCFCGNSWDEVKKKVDELEKQIIDILHNVFNNFKYLDSTKPQDEFHEVVLE